MAVLRTYNVGSTVTPCEGVTGAVKTILVVDDEEHIRELATMYLENEGYTVLTAADGEEALATARAKSPDLIVLDVMMPRLDGLDVCRELRKESDVPVLMLTARSEEVDRIVGLELGADDYMGKPFNPRELAARVKAVLRRTGQRNQVDGDALRFNDLRINGKTRSVENGGNEIHLTAREFDLLFFMASHPNQVFTRDQLLDSVWDFEFPGDGNTVTVHIRRLRSKLESDASRPRHIKTVWGVGYKFEP